MHRRIIAIIVLIITSLIFYFVILPALNITQFLESLKSVKPLIFSFALFAVLLSLVVASIRWAVLMQEINAQQSRIFFNALGIFSLGQVAGLVVPSRVGNYAKVPMITKLDNLSYEAGLSAVNAETVLDLTYICCAGIVSIFILSAFLATRLVFSWVLIVLTLLAFVGILVFLVKADNVQKIHEKLKRLASDIHRHKFVRFAAFWLGKLFALIQSTRDIFARKRTVAKLGVSTIVTQLFGVLGLLFVIESVHSALPLPDVFAILTISYLVGIVSLIPGGFGASDLSLIVLLINEGIPLEVATNIAILWRIAMYLPVLIIIGVFFLRKYITKNRIPA
jgi:uncharacterized protein (TIRG00374 family)